MILIYGIESEPPVALTINALRERQAEFIVISQRRVGQLEISPDFQAGRANGLMKLACTELAISNIEAVYWRPTDCRALPEYVNGDNRARSQILSSDATLYALFNTIDAKVISRPWAMLSNSSKPFQSTIIAESGFAVPNTLVTNSRGEIEEFVRRVGRCVYKSVSSERSIVREVTREFLGKIPNENVIPLQIQELVEGTDLRVHVVGTQTFSTAIRHTSIDYRDSMEQRREVVAVNALPSELKSSCIELTQRLGLEFSGVDLRIRKDGIVFCFEVNPCPGFSYYEQATGQAISKAVAALLTG